MQVEINRSSTGIDLRTFELRSLQSSLDAEGSALKKIREQVACQAECDGPPRAVLQVGV